jgi:hypothetical protein
VSTIRGRAIQVGGVGGEADAESRVDRNMLQRPAYRITAGQFQPIPATLGPGHPLLDLSTVGAWRLIAVGAALAYVIGFHVTLGRMNIGIGPGR